MKFKLNDKVAVYEGGKRTIQVVINYVRDTLYVSPDGDIDKTYSVVHMKQCRKLKTRARIWLGAGSNLGNQPDWSYNVSHTPKEYYREFVEVRVEVRSKKK